MSRKSSDITGTDQFCGAGGSSIGAIKGGVRIIQAQNHWELAGRTYNTNNPNVRVDITDISASDPRRYLSTNVLITSPECTNHSLAKGKGRRLYQKDLFGNVLLDPAEERSRATMWDVPRFAEFHKYEIIITENVVDAAKWILFDAWLHAMHALGYEHEIVYLNSMFAHPTPQSRDRMYVIFWKRGNRRPNLDIRPAAYCEHCGKNVDAVQSWKKRMKWGRYKAQYVYRCPACTREVTPYYYAAFNAIDFTIPAQRIGDRPIPLRPKTMARVEYGWNTYGRRPMIITGRYTSGVECRVRDATSEPIPTQPGDSSHAVLMPWVVDTTFTGDERATGGLDAVPAQTARQSNGVVMPWLIRTVRQDSDARPVSSLEPAWTQTTCQDMGIVAPAFIAELHGTSKASGLDDPMMCVTAGGNHHALVSANAFLTYYYGTAKGASKITDPIHTVTGVDRVGLAGEIDKMSVNDLTFRMFRSHEIGNTMAFPGDYKVLGNEREKVKQYGNAVTPPAMEILIKRCVETLA